MKKIIFFLLFSMNSFAIQKVPQAKITFTFDDGLKSMITKVAPLFQKYGFTPTVYIVTSCVGMTTMPNNCKASNNREYMTWDEIKRLEREFGWEVGSHTENHPLLDSTDPVEQPEKLTIDQVRNELVNSKLILNSLGLEVYSIAPPYGDYNPSVVAEIGKSYTTMRGFWDTGYNTWPFDGMLVRVQQVQGGVTVAKVKSYIDYAVKNKLWLVLVFHEVKDVASNEANAYETSTSDLEAMISYAKSKTALIKSNITEAFAPSNPNLLSGGDFTSGLGLWTTDSSASVKADSNNKGSYPGFANSINLNSTTTGEIHLFSPKISVASASTYIIKSFVDITSLNSGELFFYVDEYNLNDNWISGKYIKGINSVKASNVSMEYTPTSTNVKKAAVQIGVKGNSGINAYVDNVKFSLKDKNLLANSGFEDGLAGGWAVRNAAVVDTGNNGSFPGAVNSIKLTSTSENAFLFSPQTSVVYGKKYLIKSHINLSTLTSSELFIYVDEYDINGNWVSGKYLKGFREVVTINSQLQYTPTSTNVKRASIQIGVEKDSGITAYVDNVELYLLN